MMAQSLLLLPGCQLVLSFSVRVASCQELSFPRGYAPPRDPFEGHGSLALCALLTCRTVVLECMRTSCVAHQHTREQSFRESHCVYQLISNVVFSSGRVDKRWLQGALIGGVGVAASVALKRLLKRKRRRRAAGAAKAGQAVGFSSATGLGLNLATLDKGAERGDVAAAGRLPRLPYPQLDPGRNAGMTPGAARYERLDSGKSVGGQRGSPGIHERLDSGRSSSGLSDALLSPDARRMLPGRQGRFNSVPRSVLACRPAQNVQHLFSAAPACSCAFTDRDKRGACWKLFY